MRKRVSSKICACLANGCYMAYNHKVLDNFPRCVLLFAEANPLYEQASSTGAYRGALRGPFYAPEALGGKTPVEGSDRAGKASVAGWA